MRRLIALCVAVTLAATSMGPSIAQTAGTETETVAPFNLFALDGFGQFRVFSFDETYTDRFGVEVPTPFRLSTPLNDNLETVSDGDPDNGFVSFTWIAEHGGERKLVENLTVYAANWPLLDNGPEREAAVMALIRDRVFARITAPHGGGTLQGFGEGEVGGARAMQAAGTYTDAQWGPMLARIVAVPNPQEGPSYFMVNLISLNMVPIVHIDQTRSTLGGQSISSFTYLPAQ